MGSHQRICSHRRCHCTVQSASNIVPINTPNTDVVQTTKAVGDDLRANILRALGQDSFGVNELVQIFATSQPAMSHHLKVLRSAGLVTQRRDGTTVYYQRALPDNQLTQAIFDALGHSAITDKQQSAIEQIYAARAARSRQFFDEQADALAQQHALICPPDVYTTALVECISHHFSEGAEKGLEIGPGAGLVLRTLAPLCKSLTGIDVSSQMLAEAAGAAADLSNVDLIESDFADLALGPTYDLIVAGMVVHHMPSPARFFKKAAAVMSQGGLLVIAELCRHEQEWVKQQCGDLWQGFAPGELNEWAAMASFKRVQQQFLAQRNGFRVQVSAYLLTHTQPGTKRPE